MVGGRKLPQLIATHFGSRWRKSLLITDMTWLATVDMGLKHVGWYLRNSNVPYLVAYKMHPQFQQGKIKKKKLVKLLVNDTA